MTHLENSAEIWRRVDEKSGAFFALSDRVWGMPELNYQEQRYYKLLRYIWDLRNIILISLFLNQFLLNVHRGIRLQ